MYYCERCKKYIDEDEFVEYEENGYTYKECKCGGDLVRAETCKICGQPFVNGDSALDSYCDDCSKKTVEKFRKMMKENFNENEFEIINDIYDGEDLNSEPNETWYGQKYLYREEK